MKKLSNLFALIALLGFLVLVLAFVVSSSTCGLCGAAGVLFGVTLNVVVNGLNIAK